MTDRIGELRSAIASRDWCELEKLSNKMDTQELLYVINTKDKMLTAFCFEHSRTHKPGWDEWESEIKRIVDKIVPPGGVLLIPNFTATENDGDHECYQEPTLFLHGWNISPSYDRDLGRLFRSYSDRRFAELESPIPTDVKPFIQFYADKWVDPGLYEAWSKDMDGQIFYHSDYI